jgi:hypothetical protein
VLNAIRVAPGDLEAFVEAAAERLGEEAAQASRKCGV